MLFYDHQVYLRHTRDDQLRVSGGTYVGATPRNIIEIFRGGWINLQKKNMGCKNSGRM